MSATTTGTNLGDHTTNLGPLTTAFTPAEDCFTPRTIPENGFNVRKGSWGLSCATESGGSTTHLLSPSCVPEGLASPAGALFYTAQIYSPGNICPAGFATACSMSRTAGDDGSSYTRDDDKTLWPLLEEGETAIGCCPSGYDCDTQIITALGCQSTTSGVVPVIAMTDTDCQTTTTSVQLNIRDSFYASAPRVVLARRETDPAPTQLPKDKDPFYVEPTKGLSGGAKLGIGVGAVFGGILLIAFVICWWAGKIRCLPRRKKQPIRMTPMHGATSAANTESEALVPSGPDQGGSDEIR